jgi:hypothetical protein
MAWRGAFRCTQDTEMPQFRPSGAPQIQLIPYKGLALNNHLV